MIVSCRAFTQSGRKVKRQIEEGLARHHQIEQKEIASLSEWTKYYMETEPVSGCRSALVFIGATGIAVRSIAPYVKDKYTDPAVVVVDDQGKHVIPILSGHVGGANELAREIAGITGGEAVITTATDLHGVFAVDEFAKKNGLEISDRKKAKDISAALLSGETVGVYVDPGHLTGMVPEGLHVPPKEADLHRILIAAVCPEPGTESEKLLHLVPKSLVVGMGCRKGVPEEKLEAFLREELERRQLSLDAVYAIASLDRKKEEPGLIALAEKLGVLFLTYTKEELNQVPGTFHASAYVYGITGVDNVCERSAVRASDGGKLIIPKTTADKMTLAVAEKEWSVCFE